MKYKFGIGLLISTIVGYWIGNLLPIGWLRPTIEESGLKSSEYYSIIVQFIAAVATFFAVIAALFREEIRRYWEYVEIEYSIPDEKFVEILNPNIGSDQSSSKQIEAEKYKCVVEVFNTGTTTSHSSEIILESLIFQASHLNSSEQLETQGIPIKWGNTSESRITIPPKGKKRIIILELTPPDSESSPGGAATQTLPIMIFAGLGEDIVNKNGTWLATYMLYSSNSKSKRFSVEIKWNGQWQGRKTEMNKCLTIELKR